MGYLGQVTMETQSAAMEKLAHACAQCVPGPFSFSINSKGLCTIEARLMVVLSKA